jgi:hypothetical protein
VRQFCSYQSKSGHSQWTLKPSKMAQTVGKAWEPAAAAANRRCAAAGTIEAVAGPLV